MTKHLATIQIDTAADTAASIIWMHGLGASANDFVSMPSELNLKGCPPIRFIFPNAPTMPVTVFNGAVAPAWYDVVGSDLQRRGPEDEAGLRRSQARIEQLIDAEIARGMPSERIVLAGFSQGSAMTMQTGLRYPKKLAGLMCLSGYLPIHGTVAAERSAANQDTPIFMAHGRFDDVVILPRATESRDYLKELGYAVEWHEYDMQHSVSPQEVRDIGAWLRGILA